MDLNASVSMPIQRNKPHGFCYLRAIKSVLDTE